MSGKQFRGFEDKQTKAFNDRQFRAFYNFKPGKKELYHYDNDATVTVPTPRASAREFPAITPRVDVIKIPVFLSILLSLTVVTLEALLLVLLYIVVRFIFL